ncbi:unnamed protein product, partial [marine sediment metagenome]
MNDSNPAKPKLRWYQFSLRTLLLFVMVAGMGLGWLGSKVQPIRDEQNAVADIRRMGGRLDFSGIRPSAYGFKSRLQRHAA